VKHINDQLTQAEADQFGRASASLLHQGASSLSSELKDRLYAARMKALSLKKPERVRVQKRALVSSTGIWGSNSSNGVWDTVSWAAPLAVLVFGLIGIAQWQDDSRINDIAEVDAALLTDDVPPDAYADSGFMAFLKNGPISDSTNNDSIQSK
jgi:hypothetical protein